MNLKEVLEDYRDDAKALKNILLALDFAMQRIHEKGYFISNFDPEKIILNNEKFSFLSFKGLLSRDEYDKSGMRVNLYQAAKIGLLAYSNMKIEGNMNQEYYRLIRDNLSTFNKYEVIPSDLYEYYEEVFLRGHVGYLLDYLEKKMENKGGYANQKRLSTEVGRQFVENANENQAFINVLFIPSILALLYFVGLFIYTFIIK